ncbi:unnamed protein product, partial [Rotaria sp. Silwood1]
MPLDLIEISCIELEKCVQ